MADAELVQLSHLLATLRSMDTIANNIANTSTPGYKRESVTFEEVLAKASPTEGDANSDPVSFVTDAQVARDPSQGRIERTEAPYDLAIEGPGYFVVRTAAGERYTRNGHFSLDALGRLVAEGGAPVLGEGGEILVSPEDGVAHVAADGTVGGKKGLLGKLRVVSFQEERALRKEGDSLYSTDQAPLAATGRLVQGAIEASNVEPVVEISRMIEVTRAYDATANLMKPREGEATEMERLGSIP